MCIINPQGANGYIIYADVCKLPVTTLNAVYLNYLLKTRWHYASLGEFNKLNEL